MNVFGTILAIALIGGACFLIYRNVKVMIVNHKAKKALKAKKQEENVNNSKESK